MVEKINIFNVKFGDCFILEDNLNKQHSDKMLVDFGSIQKIEPEVIYWVNYELGTAKSKYLMVTHFHSDHYKGIKELNKNIIFDEIYLPNYFSKDIVKLQFTLLSVLNESNPAYQIAYNLLSVIPDLIEHLDNNSGIRFVKRGEYIFNNVDSFRVLWPNVNSFEEQAKQLYTEVCSYYNISKEKQNYIEGIAEGYFTAFAKERAHGESRDDLYFRGAELQREDIQKIKTNIENISYKETKPKKRLSRKLSKEISSYQNKVCICFDNGYDKNISNYKNVLFLSDISSDYLQEIIESKDFYELALQKSYNVIKVPHHGTKDYFVSNLPSSIHLIVPNGEEKNNSWKITALYGWHYKERSFICADYSACDYYLANRQCDAYAKNYCICGFETNYILNL